MREIQNDPRFASDTEADQTLVVLLHCYTGNPSTLVPVANVVRNTLAHPAFLVPDLPLGFVSTEDPVAIVRQVMALMEARMELRRVNGWPPFQDIVLVGHSMGALLARKIYVLAGPESADAPFEDSAEGVLAPAKSWFPSIRRIVLFAGMNRGWSLNHHLSLSRAVGTQFGLVVGNLLLTLTGKKLVILNARRGASFLTQLRLQWLALQRHLEQTDHPKPLTIQMLGTVDDLVSPDDNIDLVTGRDFVYLDVPYSGHGDVIQLDHPTHGPARSAVFQRTLHEDADTLLRDTLLPQDLELAASRQGVTDVIFVVHGIRDLGYWTRKIARKVESLGNAPPRIYASETSSYGYFALFSFLLPGRRREKTEWLMDQYVEAKSLYPQARFTCVGHSNGTYLLAKALQTYRACRFERVVFAGSVVRTDYDWTSVIARGQVGGVLNYIATRDWVVAFFPGALEMFNLQDLGCAGHKGFSDQSPQVFQTRYVHGAHSAALAEENWDHIAHFITAPQLTASACPIVKSRQNPWVVGIGKVAPLVWVGILIIVLTGAGGLFYVSRDHPSTQALLLAAYVMLIGMVLTRF